MSDVAVVVTCHAQYLAWLPQALASIDAQDPPPAERVLVFDGSAETTTTAGFDGWRVLAGEWGHPSGARNLGMAATAAPWVVFWDADNVMPRGYLAAIRQVTANAPSDLGIVYPDIHLHDQDLQPNAVWTMPEWDYWSLRAENCIDASAAWRREAVDLAGGWSTRVQVFEDYVLALDVTALGWRAQHLGGPPIVKRVHPHSRMQRRRDEGGICTDLWRARSLGILTLLAGRAATLPRWEQFLLDAELPPKTALHIVDNSGNPDFSRQALAAAERIAVRRGLSHLTFKTFGQAYQAGDTEPYMTRQRHLHIARLYAEALPSLGEDLILTLEDDVEPPPAAVRMLGEEVGCTSLGRVGVVAAAYALPQDAGYVCAGQGNGDDWGELIPWHQLPEQATDVSCVGGGCTMWAGWALRGRPVNFWWSQGLGWDGALSINLRRQGYHVRLHGGVRCQHHLHGRLG